ncbi:DUF4397 domain-containing protein [Georgenia wutianyii]|uniref:DUF4397 domain-containing protein n=1 Tax=Georgenia wutianyii TaxID=2585135 RepID=A0ABX5VTM8_9MICO|nr:DUF4397 domain-containing protein [Georgenia wutianyii]QDB80390.1 DUF4397 domain-containing protein [Georgenia wutianyii]
MGTTAVRRAAIGSAAGLALLALAVPATATTSDVAQLSVLHGVPDLTVDVYVNGENTLDDFEPATLAGPLELPAGTYTVAITAADAADDSAPVLGPIDLDLESGGNYTAVAHLDADGAPTVSFFTNDTSTTAAGEGRLAVRHTAAAPEVDILAGDQAVISNLANGSEQVLDLAAATVPASIAATGTTEAVLGPVDVPVEEGSKTIVYAWGSLEDGTLDVATQTISGLHSAPAGVPTGLVPVDEPGVPAGAIVAGSAALLLVAALGTRRLVRNRA